jgi:hypothetical protein
MPHREKKDKEKERKKKKVGMVVLSEEDRGMSPDFTKDHKRGFLLRTFPWVPQHIFQSNHFN